MAFNSLIQKLLFKIALENGQVPQFLSIYTTIDTLNLLIKGHTIKFSRISEFNDIKECFSVVDSNCSREEWYEYLRLNAPDKPKCLLDSTVDTIMKDPEQAKSIITDAIREINQNLGILCLAEKNDINLMWAHYTGNHCGVCLEFDITKDLDAFCFPKKVEYDDDVNKYNYVRSWLTNGGIEATNSIFHKSREWSYEEEWRIVRINGAGLVKFNIEALRTVIFGYNTPQEQIDEIKALCHENTLNHIEFKKISLDSETGELTPQNI